MQPAYNIKSSPTGSTQLTCSGKLVGLLWAHTIWLKNLSRSSWVWPVIICLVHCGCFDGCFDCCFDVCFDCCRDAADELARSMTATTCFDWFGAIAELAA